MIRLLHLQVLRHSSMKKPCYVRVSTIRSLLLLFHIIKNICFFLISMYVSPLICPFPSTFEGKKKKTDPSSRPLIILIHGLPRKKPSHQVNCISWYIVYLTMHHNKPGHPSSSQADSCLSHVISL